MSVPFIAPVGSAEAAWIYKGMFQEGKFSKPVHRRVEVPVDVAVFPHDLMAFSPRSMEERGDNIMHWKAMPRGGHFASLQEPGLILRDVQAFAASL